MTTVDLRTHPSRATAVPPGASGVRRHLSSGRHAGPPRAEQSPATFRPDLEGLRAVAILAVVAVHAGVGVLPGGFVGVDVFFVLSGFLITGLVVRELQATGTVSVSRFYARRAKRLLPATAVVLLFVAVASTLVVSVVDRGEVGVDVVAAALYVANWRFGLDAVDYFAAGSPSPVLHFWSLAVEEQFYLVWPWVLLAVTRQARLRGRSATAPLLVATATVAAVSLWWSATQTESDPAWAYFSTLTRAWELAVGGALVLLLPMIRRLPRAVAALSGWLGALAVLWSCLRFTDSMPFPGTAALVPVLGTAALIVAGTRLPQAGVSRLLSHAMLVRIGGVSYSWYLWHWPLLVLAAILAGGRLELWQALPVVALSYVVATLSRRYVEEPFHHSPTLATHPDRALRLGAACTAAGVLAGLVLVVPAVAGRSEPDAPSAPGAAALTDPVIEPAPAGERPAGDPARGFVPSITQLRDDLPATFADGCHQRYPDTAVPDCVYGVPEGARTILLMGDSHAATWFPALDALARERGWRLVNLTKHACPVAAVRVWSDLLKRSYRECSEWRTAALARVARERPDVVVVAGRSDYGVVRGSTLLGDAPSAQALQAASSRTYRQLDRIAGSVVVLRDNPMLSADPVECLARNLENSAACSTASSDLVAVPDLEAASAATAGVEFLDTRPAFCIQQSCPAVIGGVAVYRDDQHVSATYSLTLRSLLGPVLARLMR